MLTPIGTLSLFKWAKCQKCFEKGQLFLGMEYGGGYKFSSIFGVAKNVELTFWEGGNFLDKQF